MAISNLVLGDAETHCPICNRKLISKKKKGEILKVCSKRHFFRVNIRIINLGKEEK
jgi:hypothetical protein